MCRSGNRPCRCCETSLLPALTLGVYVSGIFARFLRASLVGELKADYVRTARSKGLRERDIVGAPCHAQRAPAVRHHRRPDDGELHRRRGGDRGGVHLSGAGAPADPAISTRDYPLIQGCILVILVIYVGINMMVDVLYAYIDPRIEYA